MNAGPRCKLCARRHWTYEPHVKVDITKTIDVFREMQGYEGEAKPLVIPPNNVTPVTKIGRGRPKRYENSAERQKAYRDRQK